MRYAIKRAGRGYDVDHGENCYDGQFTPQQTRSFVTQLLREGNVVVDEDTHSYVDSAEDVPLLEERES